MPGLVSRVQKKENAMFGVSNKIISIKSEAHY